MQKRLKFFFGQLDTLRTVVLYFKNPLFVILLRLGIIKIPYFFYCIQRGPQKYSMMARPTTTSLADLFILKELFVQETYKDILKNLPKEHVRFVDVGGNIGAFSIWLASKTKICEGFIFEPLEENQRLLRFNLSINKVKSVEVIPAALGGTNRQVTMNFNINSPGGSSIYTHPNCIESIAEKTQVKAFRDWLGEIQGRFHLLKLDCEGAEWEILAETPQEYFNRFHLIVAEVHATTNNPDVSEFLKYFEKAGFRTERWDNCSHGLYIGVRKG